MNINGIGNIPFLKDIGKSKENKNTSVDFAKQLESSVGAENTGKVDNTSAFTSSISITTAITQVNARNVTYRNSDTVKVNVLYGYTLKAQADTKSGIVYIERKNEDGTVNGYEVDLTKVNKDSDNFMEKIALEVYNKKLNSDFTLFSDAVSQYSDYVQDKIINGDTKFQIGGSAMSLKDWDKLIGKVDMNLDEVKVVQEERTEKQKEQEKETKEVNGVTPEMIKALMVDRSAE
jgi:hypothetical protein